MVRLRKKNQIFVSVAVISLAFFGCSKKSEDSSSLSSIISGMASLGPVDGGTVSAYKLLTDGTQGDLVSTATTNSTGAFSISIPQDAGPVMLSITGGSYVEESSGQTVSLTGESLRVMIDDPAVQTTASITPLTEMAAERAKKLYAQGIDIESAIATANDEIEAAAGISSLYTMPANPNSTISDPNSDASKYALFLAGMSRMAEDKGVDSLSMMEAFMKDFRSDGSFDGDDNGAPVAIGTTSSTLASNEWSSGMSTAMSNYVSSPDNLAGFNSGYLPAPVADPSVTVPPATFTPPTITAPVASLIMVGGPMTISANMCMPLMVGLMDANHNMAAATSTLSISLAVTGASLFSNSGCTTSASSVSISSGSYSGQIYVKATSAGSVQIQASNSSLTSGALSLTSN